MLDASSADQPKYQSKALITSNLYIFMKHKS